MRPPIPNEICLTEKGLSLFMQVTGLTPSVDSATGLIKLTTESGVVHWWIHKGDGIFCFLKLLGEMV